MTITANTDASTTSAVIYPSANKKHVKGVSAEQLSKILSRAFPNFAWVNDEDFTFSRLSDEVGSFNPVYRVLVKDLKRTGVPQLALKISNPMWKETNKTRNEAVIMSFLARHLSTVMAKEDGEVKGGLMEEQPVVPRVYDFDDSGKVLEGVQYMLMDFIGGKNLAEVDFYNLDDSIRHYIVDQIAEVYVAMKSFVVEPQQFGCFYDLQLTHPHSLHVTGTIAPDADTNAPPTPHASVWAQNTLKYRIQQVDNLSKTDTEEFYLPLANLMREALSVIANPESGIPIVLGGLPNNDRLCITYCDWQLPNVMVDEKTYKLKGIIDWEWACLTLSHLSLDLCFLGKEDQSLFEDRLLHHADVLGNRYPETKPFFKNIVPDRTTLYHNILLRVLNVLDASMCVATLHTWPGTATERAGYKAKYEEQLIDSVARLTALLPPNSHSSHQIGHHVLGSLFHHIQHSVTSAMLPLHI